MKTLVPLALISACLGAVVLLPAAQAAAPGAGDDFSSKFKPRTNATPAPAGAAQTLDVLALASDPFLVDCLYKQPKHLGSTGTPSGAVSVNAEWEKDPAKPWFI